MFRVSNNTTQPQELSGGRILGAGESVELAEIKGRERALEGRGFIAFREIRQTVNADVPQASTHSSQASTIKLSKGKNK